MLSKLLSILLLPFALIISLFETPVQKAELPNNICESVPTGNEKRTYDKITGNGSESAI